MTNLTAGYELDHIGVVVNDCDESVKYYYHKLGFQQTGSYENERIKIAFVSFHNHTLELLQYHGRQSQPGKIDHIAFRVNDIESVIAQAKEKGIKLLSESPNLVLGGSKKNIFFIGPDGEKLEFIQTLK